MTRDAFNAVKVNDKLKVGGRSRIRGEHILVREKIGDYVRAIDKRLETRLYHFQFVTMHEQFSKGDTHHE